MTQWQEKAVLLSREAEREADLRLELFTPGQGRLTASAKSALRSQKRFVGAFDLGCLIMVGLRIARPTGRVVVEYAEVVELFPSFRQHPLRLARAALLLEIIQLTVAEGEPAPETFSSLCRGLRRLQAEPDHDRWAVTYAYRLVGAAGYKPCFEACLHCRTPLLDSSLLFSPAAGGLICPSCAALPPGLSGIPASDHLPLSRETARTLTSLMAFPENRLQRIQVSSRALAEARQILTPFLTFHLGRPPHSLLFLEALRTSAPPLPQGKTYV